MLERPKGLAPDSHMMRNIYECPCGETWEDVWDCGVNDQCGACGRYISPIESEDVEGCDCLECVKNREEVATPAVKIADDNPPLSSRILALLQTIAGVIDTTDSEHPEFLDSGADSIALLWEHNAEIRQVIDEVARAPKLRAVIGFGDDVRIVVAGVNAAAAPELLAAAKDAETEIRELRAWIDQNVSSGAVKPDAWAKLHKPMVTTVTCRNLRAAIAKAEGRS